MKQRALFICTHNSARSQLAEGLLRHYYGDLFESFSAGTHPSKVHPLAIRVMQELGIDISTQRSKSVNVYRGQSFDYIITVCGNAQKQCPFFPGGKKYIHAGFEDPSAAIGTEEQQLGAFRKIRDEIKEWIAAKLTQN